ncbi:MAG: NUDIX hydrolase [Bacteroidota bacterium]|nr:NUDIX hydrolase [Bacteroidota bacterium]
MDAPWECIEAKSRGSFRVFDLSELVCRSPRTGQPHSFYVLDSQDWVNVIPVTRDRQIVCIRQWRPGTQQIELEVPGGLVDAGESPMDAAARELREESGYTASALTHLGTMAPNPAILSNQCHFFAAFDACLSHKQELDAGEAISVVLVDQDEVPTLIQTGVIRSGIIVAALCYFMMFQQTE